MSHITGSLFGLSQFRHQVLFKSRTWWGSSGWKGALGRGGGLFSMCPWVGDWDTFVSISAFIMSEIKHASKTTEGPLIEGEETHWRLYGAVHQRIKDYREKGHCQRIDGCKWNSKLHANLKLNVMSFCQTLWKSMPWVFEPGGHTHFEST